MTPAQAWTRGWQTLRQHPWLAMIPLGWNVLQIALAWAGIPLGAVPDLSRLADSRFSSLMALGSPTDQFQIRSFVPAWLPGISELQLAIQPETLAVPVGVLLPAQLSGLILVPLLEAGATAAFLVLLAQAVTLGRASLPQALPRILRTLPTLYVLKLGWRIAVMTLPIDGLVVPGGVWMILYPLLPLVIVAGDMRLGKALVEAPGALWGHFGRWFGLGWRTLLITLLFSALWQVLGRSYVIGLALYPFVATGLVAAAVALYLAPAETPEVQPSRVSWAMVGSLGLVLALAGSHLAQQWDGYRITRELTFESNPDSSPMFFVRPSGPPVIVYTRQEADREIVLYRREPEVLGIAELKRTRFGWRKLWHQEERHHVSMREGRPDPPAHIHWMRPSPGYGRFFIWGEIYDSRAAYLELAGGGFELAEGEPLFIIPVSDQPRYGSDGRLDIRLLDENLQPLDAEGGVRP